MDLGNLAQLVDINKLNDVPDSNPVKAIFIDMVSQIRAHPNVNPAELIPAMMTHLQEAMQSANVQQCHVEEMIATMVGPAGQAQLMAMAQAFAPDGMDDLEEDDPMAARRQAILRMEQERRQ